MTSSTAHSARQPAPPADGVLVAAARQGDMRAFEGLYRLHCAKVMGLCCRMVRERDVAEDCVQQTFIKAWQNMDAFEARSNFSTWLHSIAVRVVIQHLRSRKTWLEFGAEPTDGDVAVATMDVGVSEIFDMERALLTLPEGARCVLVLQAIYGYSHEEVGGMLGIAVGTCKAQLNRARQLLRQRFEMRGTDHE